MTENDIKLLKSKIDKDAVHIIFTDGEKMDAVIRFVLEDEKEVICDIISTDRSDKYSSYKSMHIVFPFTDIKSVS